MRKILEKKSKGFTLVELVIVIVILVVLAGIAIPSVGSYIARGRTTSALADANQLAAALNIYNATLSTPLNAVPGATIESTLQDRNIMPKLKGSIATVLSNIVYDGTSTKLFEAKTTSLNLTGY